jgi:hypothetical protein
LDALSKTLSIRDADGNSILKMICQKLFDEDNSFADFKQDYEFSYMAHKCIVDDIKRDCLKAKGDLKTNQNMFEMIVK